MVLLSKRWCLSPLICPFLPTTHTRHTHTCGFLSVWTLCSPSVWFDLIFPLSHLISIPPSLSVRTGKKQGPPENRNKGNPSIHPSVPLCPFILPVSHPLLTLHTAAGGECPVHLFLSVTAVKRGMFSRLALPVKGCNSQPSGLWQPIAASTVIVESDTGWLWS